MTRENVKRQFTQYSACDPRECSKCADDALDRAVDEIVRLRAKLQAARDGIAKIIMHTGRLPNASPDFLAALGGDDA